MKCNPETCKDLYCQATGECCAEEEGEEEHFAEPDAKSASDSINRENAADINRDNKRETR